MKKKIAAVIPARMGSSRFPGKPLAKILGLPMIEHVRRRVLLSDVIDKVYVATCDQEIMDIVNSFGGEAIMTSDTHERCTERVEEAARNIDADIIVIVQGDEPLFIPAIFKGLIEPIISNDSVVCTNLLSVIDKREDLKDVDIVKAVIDQESSILYFSRAPIPFYRVKSEARSYRQTGISAFKSDFLRQFTKLPQTPLEVAESVDFLRILEHGYKIRGVVVSQETFGVDREDDIPIIERILKNDKIQKEYFDIIKKI
ncbi:MAG: 3-deoxy-manno-octulosonate cytidylyltransferase [bacterium]